MIIVKRSSEPNSLIEIRAEKLNALRRLGRDPFSKEIKGYDVVAEQLWRDQKFKCCYCESKIPKGYNDVEHYRPKAAADRMPGSPLKHGYWWLAFSWENLLFACPACNRSAKNSLFPLQPGSQPLISEAAPPGNELPLLINPASGINPVAHIEFKKGGVDGGLCLEMVV